jgi:peptide chain release factor 2
MRERQRLESAIAAVRETERDLNDNIGLIELGRGRGRQRDHRRRGSGDRAHFGRNGTAAGRDAVSPARLTAMTSYLEIHAGAAGTESQDWAQMLLPHVHAVAERSGYKVETLDFHDGEEAGMQVGHHPLQGRERLWLAETESGVHRLFAFPLRQPGSRTPASLGVGVIRRGRIHPDRLTRATCASTPNASSGSGAST